MNRREVLAGGMSTSILGACVSMPSELSSTSSNLPVRLVDFSALQLSDAIRSRQVSCTETMEAYLAQIEKYNPTYNALISMLPKDRCLQFAKLADEALAEGQYWGWMHGMPFAFKEFVDVKGFVTSYGSPLLADNVAQKDSLLATRVKSQGAIIFGKTNVPEWGFGEVDDNSDGMLTQAPRIDVDIPPAKTSLLFICFLTY